MFKLNLTYFPRRIEEIAIALSASSDLIWPFLPLVGPATQTLLVAMADRYWLHGSFIWLHDIFLHLFWLI